MKTTLSRHAAYAASALIASFLAATTYAGPGPQYWANLHTTSETPAPAKPAATATACSRSQEVAVTVMKPAWANGRGPLTEAQIGTERVCHLCPVTTVTSTNAWANGRGPITRAETTSVGPTHRCATGCTLISVASN